jgi:cell division protein FtsL
MAAAKSSGNIDAGVKGKGKGDAKAGPVVRLRSVFLGVCVLALSIAGPLVLVWTQSYINQVSLRVDGKEQALAAANSEITALALERERLSGSARVERIARSRGLEYPASGQIEVWEVRAPRSGGGGLFARNGQTLLGGDKAGGSL